MSWPLPEPAGYEAVRLAFAALRKLDADGRGVALAAIEDPEVRREVAELLLLDDDRPLFRDPPLGSGAPDARPPPAVIGRLLDGRYEVQALAADGGFGWVFRGRDSESDEPVAIKLFKPIDDPELADQVGVAFVQEGVVLRALAADTPHVVEYRDVGAWFDDEGDRFPYLVMQWLDGPTLRTFARERAPDGLPFSEAVELLAPIARALAAAHQRGIAHRDVKPQNVVCVGDPQRPKLVLVDFGAVKLAADRARGFESTGAKPRMVTYAYSAPEQLDRALGPTGPWSDVRALALMLVELRLGHHPFGELDLRATMAAVTDPARRSTPGRLGLGVPAPVEAVSHAALSVPIRRRPRDARALWSALSDAMKPPARRRFGRQNLDPRRGET